MEVATIFIVGHYNQIARVRLFGIGRPVTPDGIKTENLIEKLRRSGLLDILRSVLNL